jgi:putative IMPACT (imprinted ancient) family translation regulator
MARLAVRCDFAELALLKARSKGWHAQITRESFDTGGATLELELPAHLADEACARIGDLTRGHGEIRRLD